MTPVVTVSVSYWGCGEYVRQAVKSCLDQTDPRLVIVVINDGDRADPPAEKLRGLDDPRLVVIDSPHNRGPYWNHEVVLRAASTPYLLIQDADDISAPSRVERLLATIGDAPFAASYLGGAYHGAANAPEGRKLGPSHKHRYSHASLHRVQDLLALGGYHPGQACRVGFDTLIMNAQALIGERRKTPCRVVEENLYQVRSRRDSLTRATTTGLRSDYRKKLWVTYAQMWERIWERRREADLVSFARKVLFAKTNGAEQEQIRAAAEALKVQIKRAAARLG